MFAVSGKIITPDAAFTDAKGLQYPAGWLRLASPADKAAAGVRDVTYVDQPPPGAALGYVRTESFDGDHTVTVTYTPKSVADVWPSLERAVDDLAGGIYDRGARFDHEHQQRESAARAFKAAGYAGDPTVWVSAYAQAAGKTAQEAADTIMARAESQRLALQTLGALRMRKHALQDAADVPALLALHADIVAQINATAAALV